MGVHLGFTSNGSQVLGSLMREMGLLHGSVDSFAEKWRKMRPLIIGAVAGFAGIKALEGMWKLVDGAKELNTQLERTKQLGGEFAGHIDQTRMLAFQTSAAVPTTAASDNVKVQRELAAQLQSQEKADAILPLAQRTAYVISHFTGESTDDIVKNLTKVAELRAQIFKEENGKEVVDPAKVTTEFNSAMRALLLTGGFLKSTDLVQMAKQGGVPAKQMTPEAFYADAAEMAVSQGASRTGTSLTSMLAQFEGGTMTRRVAEEMERMKLLSPNDWRAERGGAIVVQDDAKTRLAKEVGPDPISYITGPLNDRMTAMGMDAQAKLEEVFKLFGRQTTQRLVAEALSSGPLFQRARAMFGTIPDADTQYGELQKNDFDTNVKSFTAAWKSFIEALGEQGIPLAINVLHGLTDALHALTAWAVEHPEATKYIEMTAASLAALAAVGGSLVVAAFSIKLVAGSLGALSGIQGLFGLGGGLRAVGAGLSVMSELTGLSALGAGLKGVATGIGELLGLTGLATLGVGLAAVAGGVSALYGILKLGDNHETPENRTLQENLNRQRRAPTPLDRMEPQDGYGVDGRPELSPTARPESFVPPPANTSPVNMNVNLKGDVNVDGRKLGEITAKGLTSSHPDSGPTGFDPSTSAFGIGP